MTSIRNRLIIIIFFTLFICIGAITLFTFHYAKEEFTEVMDGSLQQLAISISLNAPASNKQNITDKVILADESEFFIQIWHAGKLKYTSHPMIKVELQAQPGYGNTSFANGNLRYYQYINGNEIIQVFQSLDERRDMLEDIQHRFIGPILFIAPLFLIAIYIAIGKGLAPLVMLSNRLKERDAANLHPIDMKDVPLEIAPLIQALNQLLKRLESSLLLQRQFTSDAAHELRTPLTAIKLQLDMLKRADDNLAERHEIEMALNAATERSTKLVENLLLLARSETDRLTIKAENVNLSHIAAEVVKDLSTLSASKNQTIIFSGENDEAIISADSPNIYVVIENLLQNAILYNNEYGKVKLSITCDEKQVILSVIDNGIGINITEHSRVFDRFYRGQGIKQMGSGLGLSIVKNIVEYYNGNIAITDGLDGTGTGFMIRFPQII